MLNESSCQIFSKALQFPERIGCRRTFVGDTQVLDAGIDVRGSLDAGILLSRLCLGDRGKVSVVPCDLSTLISPNAIFMQTDDVVMACLGSQYAGWPVQTDDFFAMGSGPMRLLRGREDALRELQLAESGDRAVGVLESDKFPTPAAIDLISQECGVDPAKVHLAVAPSTSIAGSLQVVARSVETAMHKLHALEFDVRTVVSATGIAPLPPPAKQGDTINGIGRTNDAMLYGATVTLWVDTDDEVVEEIAAKVPSNSSSDYGQPFAKIFKQYDYDFYKVDPLLFSPAVVTIHNLQSGRTWNNGSISTEVLRQSFLQ